jgi:hypothetical protein
VEPLHSGTFIQWNLHTVKLNLHTQEPSYSGTFHLCCKISAKEERDMYHSQICLANMNFIILQQEI